MGDEQKGGGGGPRHQHDVVGGSATVDGAECCQHGCYNISPAVNAISGGGGSSSSSSRV